MNDRVSGKEKHAEDKVKNESKRVKEIEDDGDGQGQEEQGLEGPLVVRQELIS